MESPNDYTLSTQEVLEPPTHITAQPRAACNFCGKPVPEAVGNPQWPFTRKHGRGLIVCCSDACLRWQKYERGRTNTISALKARGYDDETIAKRLEALAKIEQPPMPRPEPWVSPDAQVTTEQEPKQEPEPKPEPKTEPKPEPKPQKVQVTRTEPKPMPKEEPKAKRLAVRTRLDGHFLQGIVNGDRLDEMTIDCTDMGSFKLDDLVLLWQEIGEAIDFMGGRR